MLEGQVSVTSWHEEVIESFEHAKIARVEATLHYEGQMVADSKAFLTLYYDANAEARFVGFEIIKGFHGSEALALTLQHRGRFVQGVLHSFFSAVCVEGNVDDEQIEGKYIINSKEESFYEISI